MRRGGRAISPQKGVTMKAIHIILILGALGVLLLLAARDRGEDQRKLLELQDRAERAKAGLPAR